MKLEFVVFSITTFLVVNTYYDGKYTKMLSVSKKYIQMSMFAFVGFSIYLLLKETQMNLGVFYHMPILLLNICL